MNMRRFAMLFLAAALLLAAAWVVSAHGPDPAPASAPTSSPTLRLNLGPTDPTLDPVLAGSAQSALVSNQLFLGLVRPDDLTGQPVPELASSWAMSPDARVFTFTLRSGLTWTDGNPLTAYDVRYGILRSLDPATQAGNAYALFYIQNAEEYYNGTVTDPDQVGVTVLDYYHLRFTLNQAAAFFPGTLTWPVARPMPQWAIDAHPTDWTEPAYIVTNGAYRLVEWHHGTSMLLEKNPTYYDAANVQIGRVSFVMKDDGAAWDLYRAGQLDSAVVPVEEWPAAVSDPALAGQLHPASLLRTYYYGFNMAKPPFNQALVRMAFAAAVDRQGLLDAVIRYADLPAQTFTPPGLWGHVDGPSEGVGIAYDPQQARQWLAAAGYPNGQGLPPITMMFDVRFFDQNLAVASYLQQGWADELGATVTISYTNSWPEYLELLQTDPPQLWQLRWGADHYDAYNFLREGVEGVGRLKYGNWYNPVYEGLLDLAARTADLNARAGLYQQAEEILVETDAVMVPIRYVANGIAAKPYLERTYGDGGFGGRIAGWRIVHRLFLPLVERHPG